MEHLRFICSGETLDGSRWVYVQYTQVDYVYFTDVEKA